MPVSSTEYMDSNFVFDFMFKIVLILIYKKFAILKN